MPGQLFHMGIHLDGLEPNLREVHSEDGGDVTAAETDQADLCRIRPEEVSGKHHCRVFKNRGVRFREFDAGLTEITLPAEDHAPLPAVLADGDVVID